MTNKLKRLSAVICSFVLLACSLCACKKEQANLTTVTLNEVAHSIFYAPQYVAIELGYFEEEGLQLELVTGFGADKTMSALVAGEADIGFMGSESSIYLYNEGAEDYAVNFAQLTQRAGNFLVARENTDHFQWSDLIGKEIIGGRPGGMPEMVLEYILKLNNIDPEQDVTLVQNIDFGNTSGAFAGGTGAYTVEFEPSATALEQQGAGYVVASLGVDSGYVPYTAYCAKKSYLEQNPEVIQSFTNALQKGMDYVNSHTPEEIAKVIAPQFEETDVETLTIIVERYAAQDTWKNNLIFEEDSFLLLENILNEAGELETFAPYEDLVDNSYAQKAFQ